MYVRLHKQILTRCFHDETIRRVVIFIQILVIDNYRLITALKPTYIEKWQQDVIICRQSLQNLHRKKWVPMVFTEQRVEHYILCIVLVKKNYGNGDALT